MIPLALEACTTSIDPCYLYPQVDTEKLAKAVASHCQFNPANVVFGLGSDELLQRIAILLLLMMSPPHKLVQKRRILKVFDNALRLPKFLNSQGYATDEAELKQPTMQSGTAWRRQHFAGASVSDEKLV